MLGAIGEYLPKVDHQSAAETFSIYAHRGFVDESWITSKSCSVSSPRLLRFEALQLRMTVHCERPTLLALPVSVNPYTSIFEVGVNGSLRPVHPVKQSQDPLIMVWIPSDKPEQLLVNLPTLWSAL
jgi:hypothetical protein